MNTTVKLYGGDREGLADFAARANLQRAIHGDTKATGELCKLIANLIENNQPIPPAAQMYLIKALREVGTRASSGYPKIGFADKAFLLRLEGGGRRWWLENESRDLLLAIHMEDYLRENPRHPQAKAAKHAREKLVEAGFDTEVIDDRTARKLLRRYRKAKPAPS